MNCPKLLYFDGEVLPQVYKVITESSEVITVVTPYLRLWEHLKSKLEDAFDRNVQVFFVIRDTDEAIPKKRPAEDVRWLDNLGVRIIQVPNLHAKIYMNERTALLSSMNITEPSIANSHEFAIRLESEAELMAVRNYVTPLIQRHAPDDLKYSPQQRASQRLASLVQRLGVMGSERPQRLVATRGELKPTLAKAGTCVRCGKGIEYDVRRPLCPTCYSSWAKFKNAGYIEKRCHACGGEERTTYRSPLCPACSKTAE